MCYITSMTNNSEKQKIRIRISRYLDLEGSIDSSIDILVSLKKNMTAEGFSDINIETDNNDWDEGRSLSVYGKRLETEAEFSLRLDKEAIARADKKAIWTLKEEVWKMSKFILFGIGVMLMFGGMLGVGLLVIICVAFLD